jgi:hypothetical protein
VIAFGLRIMVVLALLLAAIVSGRAAWTAWNLPLDGAGFSAPNSPGRGDIAPSNVPSRPSERLDAYEQTLQRPLFFEDRKIPQREAVRPVAEPAPPTMIPTAPPPPVKIVVSTDRLRLRGIGGRGVAMTALIEVAPAGQSWFAKGDVVQGWTIDDVTSSSVELSNVGQKATLELFPAQR